MCVEPILPDLMRLQELLRSTLDRAAREAGLATSEYVVLNALERTPGLSGAELARAAKVTPQSMHGVLVRLRRDGSIELAPHPRDKRLRVFSLTARGRASARMDAARVAEIEARLTRGLPAEARERLAAALRECVAVLDGLASAAAHAEGPPGSLPTVLPDSSLL